MVVGTWLGGGRAWDGALGRAPVEAGAVEVELKVVTVVATGLDLVVG